MSIIEVPESLLKYASQTHAGFEPISGGQSPEGGYYIIGWLKPVVISAPGDEPNLLPTNTTQFLVKGSRNVPASWLLPDNNLRGFVAIHQYPTGLAVTCGNGFVLSLDQGHSEGPRQEDSVEKAGIQLQGLNITLTPVVGTRSKGRVAINGSSPITDPEEVEKIVASSAALQALKTAMLDYIGKIGAAQAQANLVVVVLDNA